MFLLAGTGMSDALTLNYLEFISGRMQKVNDIPPDGNAQKHFTF